MPTGSDIGGALRLRLNPWFCLFLRCFVSSLSGFDYHSPCLVAAYAVGGKNGSYGPAAAGGRVLPVAHSQGPCLKADLCQALSGKGKQLVSFLLHRGNGCFSPAGSFVLFAPDRILLPAARASALIAVFSVRCFGDLSAAVKAFSRIFFCRKPRRLDFFLLAPRGTP